MGLEMGGDGGEGGDGGDGERERESWRTDDPIRSNLFAEVGNGGRLSRFG